MSVDDSACFLLALFIRFTLHQLSTIVWSKQTKTWSNVSPNTLLKSELSVSLAFLNSVQLCSFEILVIVTNRISHDRKKLCGSVKWWASLMFCLLIIAVSFSLTGSRGVCMLALLCKNTDTNKFANLARLNLFKLTNHVCLQLLLYFIWLRRTDNSIFLLICIQDVLIHKTCYAISLYCEFNKPYFVWSATSRKRTNNSNVLFCHFGWKRLKNIKNSCALALLACSLLSLGHPKCQNGQNNLVVIFVLFNILWKLFLFIFQCLKQCLDWEIWTDFCQNKNIQLMGQGSPTKSFCILVLIELTSSVFLRKHKL